jgi:hypothetical protein
MYVAVILGSDKTTMSIAMGDTEYHPVYLSIGGLHNAVWCAHCNSLIPIAFLAIPKSRKIFPLQLFFMLNDDFQVIVVTIMTLPF